MKTGRQTNISFLHPNDNVTGPSARRDLSKKIKCMEIGPPPLLLHWNGTTIFTIKQKISHKPMA